MFKFTNVGESWIIIHLFILVNHNLSNNSCCRYFLDYSFLALFLCKNYPLLLYLGWFFFLIGGFTVFDDFFEDLKPLLFPRCLTSLID